jgi:hypothetical protein
MADLETHRDRAMALAMLLGGLRAAEVRGIRLADAIWVCVSYVFRERAAENASCPLTARSSVRSGLI